jgi:molybdopterin converting factor small subunit
VNITVKLFGPEAQAAGVRELSVELPSASSTVAQLRPLLARSTPALADRLPACRFAVNHEFAAEGRVIGPDDEVAIIGSVSGG